MSRNRFLSSRQVFQLEPAPLPIPPPPFSVPTRCLMASAVCDLRGSGGRGGGGGRDTGFFVSMATGGAACKDEGEPRAARSGGGGR